MARVLIVEDDADVRLIITRALEHAGHVILFAATGKAGLELARAVPLDLVILDWTLPDVSGAQVARTLQGDLRTRELPFIFVSGLTREAERIAGLELGAEDYITKPFSVRELMLRVQVVVRRLRRADTRDKPTHIELPPLSIDVAGARVRVSDQPVALTPVELKLLVALSSRVGEAQSRERLLADVWGVRPDLATRTIDVHVNRLREKLGPVVAAALETVRGVGYVYREPG